MATGNPNRQDDQHKPAQKSATRKTMRFLFNPEFGRSASSIGTTLQMFVQMLAMLFASNGTLEKTHPFFRSDAHFTLGDLFRETRARIEWKNKAKIPQTLFFCAVWGLLTSAILYLITFVLLFVAGPSQAYAQPNPTSSSMFAVPDDDLAIQFIHNMVMGEPIEFLRQEGDATMGNALQNGLRELLKFYSSFILVIASFLLLYHIIMLVAKSAWSGKPLEGANAIWGPLRLVIAIGLLVPLGSNLNAGQHAVLKIAELGSGLATNGWNLFTSNLANDRSAKAPTATTGLKNEYAKMVMVFACYYNIDYTIKDSLSLEAEPESISIDDSPNNDWISIVDKGLSSDKSAKHYSIQQRFNNDRCGTIEIPSVGEVSQKKDTDILDNSTLYQKVQDVRAGMSEASTQLMNDAKATAKMIVMAKRQTNSESGEENSADAVIGSPAIQRKIQQDITNFVATVKAKTDAVNNNSAQYDSSGYSSWIMAGAYFYQIAAYQQSLYSAMTATPKSELGDIFWLERKEGIIGTITNMVKLRDQATAYQDNFVEVHPQYEKYLASALFGGRPTDAAEDAENANNSGWQAIGNAGSSIASYFQVEKGEFINMFRDDAAAPYTAMLNVGQTLYNNSLLVLIGGIGLKAASAIPVVGGVFDAVGGVVITLGVYMLILGVFLCFFMPLIPAIKFLMDAVSWFLAVFEAIVGMPLFALAHLTPGGDGLLDPARHGYTMLLHIAIKPILMVMGMIICIILVTIALVGLNAVFVPTFDAVWGPGDVGFVTALILLGIWVFNAYSILNVCYKFIDHLPQTAMSWFGGGGHNGLELERDVNPLVAQQYISNAAKGIGGTANSIGGGLGKRLAPKKPSDTDRIVGAIGGGGTEPGSGDDGPGGGGGSGGQGGGNYLGRLTPGAGSAGESSILSGGPGFGGNSGLSGTKASVGKFSVGAPAYKMSEDGTIQSRIPGLGAPVSGEKPQDPSAASPTVQREGLAPTRTGKAYPGAVGRALGAAKEGVNNTFGRVSAADQNFTDKAQGLIFGKDNPDNIRTANTAFGAQQQWKAGLSKLQQESNGLRGVARQEKMAEIAAHQSKRAELPEFNAPAREGGLLGKGGLASKAPGKVASVMSSLKSRGSGLAMGAAAMATVASGSGMAAESGRPSMPAATEARTSPVDAGTTEKKIDGLAGLTGNRAESTSMSGLGNADTGRAATDRTSDSQGFGSTGTEENSSRFATGDTPVAMSFASVGDHAEPAAGQGFGSNSPDQQVGVASDSATDNADSTTITDGPSAGFVTATATDNGGYSISGTQASLAPDAPSYQQASAPQVNFSTPQSTTQVAAPASLPSSSDAASRQQGSASVQAGLGSVTPQSSFQGSSVSTADTSAPAQSGSGFTARASSDAPVTAPATAPVAPASSIPQAPQQPMTMSPLQNERRSDAPAAPTLAAAAPPSPPVPNAATTIQSSVSPATSQPAFQAAPVSTGGLSSLTQGGSTFAPATAPQPHFGNAPASTPVQPVQSNSAHGFTTTPPEIQQVAPQPAPQSPSPPTPPAQNDMRSDAPRMLSPKSGVGSSSASAAQSTAQPAVQPSASAEPQQAAPRSPSAGERSPAAAPQEPAPQAAAPAPRSSLRTGTPADAAPAPTIATGGVVKAEPSIGRGTPPTQGLPPKGRK